jgi:hypothetical protein
MTNSHECFFCFEKFYKKRINNNNKKLQEIVFQPNLSFTISNNKEINLLRVYSKKANYMVAVKSRLLLILTFILSSLPQLLPPPSPPPPPLFYHYHQKQNESNDNTDNMMIVI